MKLLYAVAIALLFISSCKKNTVITVKGTVLTKLGCFPDSWLVAIDKDSGERYPFLCDGFVPVGSMYHCGNAVYMRLEGPLVQEGKKISFQFVSDEGIQCLSFSYAPHHITAKNLSL